MVGVLKITFYTFNDLEKQIGLLFFLQHNLLIRGDKVKNSYFFSLYLFIIYFVHHTKQNYIKDTLKINISLGRNKNESYMFLKIRLKNLISFEYSLKTFMFFIYTNGENPQLNALQRY